MGNYIFWTFMLAVLAVLSVGIAVFVRAYANGTTASALFFRPRSDRRLEVIEHANIDGRRKLLLIRRDDVEHLRRVADRRVGHANDHVAGPQAAGACRATLLYAGDQYAAAARQGRPALDVATWADALVVVQVPLLIGSYAATCVWLYRARANAQILSPHLHHRRSPAWMFNWRRS